MSEKSRLSRCLYCHQYMGKNHDENHCVKDGWDDDKIRNVTAEECEKCESFESRNIEFPLTINGIKNKPIDTTGVGHKCGALCEIKPCEEEYEGKSYLGIYLGDLPIAITTSLDPKTKILENGTMRNPAIFVPGLKKVIYGCESWWREIDSIEDFKGISEEDIENMWYVKLLRQSN